MPRRALALIAASIVLPAGVAVVAASSCAPPETEIVVPGCSICGPLPEIAIVSPADGACWAVPSGPDAYIPVVVSVSNFLLRPPGACGTCAACGHVRLSLNGVPDHDVASEITDISFPEGAEPFGPMTIEVELVDDCGRPWSRAITTAEADLIANGETPSCDGGLDGPDPCDAGASTIPPVSVRITAAKSCEEGPLDAGAGDAG